MKNITKTIFNVVFQVEDADEQLINPATYDSTRMKIYKTPAKNEQNKKFQIMIIFTSTIYTYMLQTIMSHTVEVCFFSSSKTNDEENFNNG